ncbi:MAG: hemerythrin family protein [Candidatus Omnitrophica bacterium]|nr:hemerythrin family protein [Candidatus Omnitrophota bacterium]MDD5500674.1 hemerythrin family protein [Candidatus Omnitrophota bacterium]
MGLYKLYKLDISVTTGIALIDGQHNELFENFNNVFKALALAKETQEMLLILEAMDACVKHHLSTEEDLMLKNNYSKYAPHKNAHIRFLENIVAIKEQTKRNGVTSNLAQMVKETIGDWFLDHIRIMDMQYVPFLKDKV